MADEKELMSPKTKKIIMYVFIGIVCVGLFWAGLLLLGGHYKCDYKTQKCSYIAFAWKYQRKGKCQSYCNYTSRQCNEDCLNLNNGTPANCTDEITGLNGSCCKMQPSICSGCEACMKECVTPC